MIVQWNGNELEIPEYGARAWQILNLHGGQGNLTLGKVRDSGLWFAFMWFFGTRARFESRDGKTAQKAVDRVCAMALEAHSEIGTALNGPVTP